MADGQVTIEILADSSDFDSAISGLGKTTQSSLSNAIKSVSIGNVLASAFQSAVSVINSSLDSAISRIDTMQNFPKVMQSLGYSADDASSAISKMSDHLTGLPTRLDAMTSSVQQIVPTVKDVGKATDIMLAFNDACLAGGASTQVQEAAVTQFAQALAKGKPEMEDWRSIQTAMPGQLDQTAKAMLGASATSNDLYNALKDGSVTMDDFCDALVRLDTEGSNGFASFSEQAKAGTAGIATSFSNLQNSVIKGLANTLDAIGTSNITGVMQAANSQITAFFKAFNSAVSAAMPTVKSFLSALAQVAPQLAACIAGFSAFNSVRGYVGTAKEAIAALAKEAEKTGTSVTKLQKVNAALGTSFSPISLAATAAIAVIGLVAYSISDYTTKTQNAEKATTGLSEAAANTASLTSYSGELQSVGTSASSARTSISELDSSLASHVDAMNKNTESAQQQVNQLATAQSIIQQYAGQTDLSASAQGKLEWALQQVNTQLGLNLTASDAASNSYTDQDGNVQNLTDSINNLIEAKKREAEMDAMQSNYTEALKAKTEAENAYADAVVNRGQDIEDTKNALIQSSNYTISQADAEAQATEIVNGKLDEYKSRVDSATSAADNIADAMGDLSKSTSDSADAFDSWGNTVSDKFGTAVAIMKKNLGDNALGQLKDDLRELGASTDDLAKLSESDMQSIAESYDGSAASIVGKLGEMGVSMDTVKKHGAEMGESVTNGIKSAIENVPAATEKFDELGINMDDFAQKCADAGLSAEDFSGMSTESFAQLYEACGGNLQAMIAQIASYNSTPLVDKDGNVNITDNTLVDANGHILTYNGTGLYDKTAGAYVDSAQVVDSTGNVWNWDGTALVSKSADATITGNAVTGDAQGQADNTQAAIDRLKSKTVTAQADGNASDGSAASNIWNTVNAISNLASKAVDVVTNTFNNVVNTVTNRQNAKGGIRLNAAGGFVPRYHANGAIATKAVPLDIVGEDGAEAIVPLTNERYSRPFAQLIAKQVVELMDRGGDIDAVRAELAAEQSTAAAVLGAAFLQGISQVVARLDSVVASLDRIERKMDADTELKLNGREFGRLVRESI